MILFQVNLDKPWNYLWCCYRKAFPTPFERVRGKVAFSYHCAWVNSFIKRRLCRPIFTQYKTTWLARIRLCKLVRIRPNRFSYDFWVSSQTVAAFDEIPDVSISFYRTLTNLATVRKISDNLQFRWRTWQCFFRQRPWQCFFENNCPALKIYRYSMPYWENYPGIPDCCCQRSAFFDCCLKRAGHFLCGLERVIKAFCERPFALYRHQPEYDKQNGDAAPSGKIFADAHAHKLSKFLLKEVSMHKIGTIFINEFPTKHSLYNYLIWKITSNICFQELSGMQ